MIRSGMLRLLFLLALVVGNGARAQEAPVRDLMAAMRLADITDLILHEGRGYADEIAQGSFPAQPSAQWQEAVAALHQPGPLLHAVRAGLSAGLSEAEMRAARAFYEGPVGQDVLAREIAMRSQMGDPVFAERIEEMGAARRERGGPVVDLVEALIEAGELIDLNVTGAMNGSYHFMRGLSEAGRGTPMDESEILRMIWQDEPIYRASTERWLFGYLIAAYDGLDEEARAEYLAFARSGAGQALTAASFDGFGAGLDEIAYRLGLLAAREMRQQGL